MPQFARPEADTVIGNYTDQAGGTNNIYEAINDASPNDATFVRSPESPDAEVYVTKLSGVTDPGVTSGHVMRMRSANDVGSGGETLDYTLQLREGYVNEGSQGTLIATLSRSNVNSATFADASHTLSGGEAGAITDYEDLYYRLVITTSA